MSDDGIPIRRVIHTIDGGTITLEPGRIPIGRDGGTISKDDAIAVGHSLRTLAMARERDGIGGTERLLRVGDALVAAAMADRP